MMGIDPAGYRIWPRVRTSLDRSTKKRSKQRGERIDAVKTEFRLLEQIHVHRYLMGKRRTKTTAGGKETYGMFTY